MKRISALAAALAVVCVLIACSGNAKSGEAAGASEHTAADGSAGSGEATIGDMEEKTGSDGDAAGKTAENTRAAVFYYSFSDSYISSVRAALDAELNAAGIVYQNFDADDSQDTQDACIDAVLGDDCKILVVDMVTPGSSDTAKDIATRAKRRGAQVIFFDHAIAEEGSEGTVLGANDNICFICSDVPEAGHGKEAVEDTAKPDAEDMARAIASMVEHTAAGTSMADGVAAVAASDEIYSVAEDIPNKLYVSYVP